MKIQRIKIPIFFSELKISLSYLFFGFVMLLLVDYLSESHFGPVIFPKIFLYGIFLLITAVFLNYSMKKLKQKAETNVSDLMKSEQEIRQILIETVEQERNRIARELHDGLQQKITGISLLTQAHLINAGLENEMRSICDGLRECISDIRRISHNMRIEEIEEGNFSELMQHFSDKISETSDLAIHFSCQDDVSFTPFCKLNLYRIVQELTTNTIKHAGAKQVLISINNSNGYTVFSYKDNGKGLSLGYHEGVGMKNIRNRIHAINGRILKPESLCGYSLSFHFRNNSY